MKPRHVDRNVTEELPIVTGIGAAPAGPLAVVVLSGELVGQLYRLEHGTTIGRASECAILLASPGVSRTHARIERDGGGLFIVDLGSRNGIAVNGVRVGRHPLKPGQQLLVGSIPLLVTTADPVHEQFLVEQRMAIARRIAAGVAHDMNNLVGIVTATTQALEQHLARGEPARAADGVAAIKDAAERMRELVGKLRGDPPRQRVAVDLHSVLAEIALMTSAAARGVEVSFDLGKDLWTIGDRTALHRAFMNLVQNALEAMGGSGGRLTVRGSRQVRPTGKSTVHVEVEDTGPGIDEGTRQKILEPYFSTKDDDAPGRGLGLTTAYETIVAHGGELEIESVVGRGTSVHVYLPFASARARHALPTSGVEE